MPGSRTCRRRVATRRMFGESVTNYLTLDEEDHPVNLGHNLVRMATNQRHSLAKTRPKMNLLIVPPVESTLSLTCHYGTKFR